MNSKPVVVFDCMIFVQALAKNSGPAAACFALVQSDAVEMLLSDSIIEEWQAVLARPKLLQHFPGITAAQVTHMIALLSERARFLSPFQASMLVDRDPKDQKYLDLAVAGEATFLVTRDRDLLDLPLESTWSQSSPTFQIVDPVTFLRLLNASSFRQ